jgi:hypothetical protein
VLKLGDTYTLCVGTRDATGGAFASAMIAITAKGHDFLHRSSAAKQP